MANKVEKCLRCEGTGMVRRTRSGHEKAGGDTFLGTMVECFTLQDFYYEHVCPNCGGRGKIFN